MIESGWLYRENRIVGWIDGLVGGDFGHLMDWLLVGSCTPLTLMLLLLVYPGVIGSCRAL